VTSVQSYVASLNELVIKRRLREQEMNRIADPTVKKESTHSHLTGLTSVSEEETSVDWSEVRMCLSDIETEGNTPVKC